MATRHRGTSLIELLAALALVAVLAGMALPSAQRWLDAASAERSLHRLNAALAYARTLAVTHGAPVTLCALSAEGRCNGDWSAGFAIFMDPERTARTNADADILRRFGPTRERIVLRAFGTRRYFRFRANGQTDWQNGRFVVCPRDASLPTRSLVINVQGRTRLERPGTTNAVCT